jgi:hypothetical protein
MGVINTLFLATVTATNEDAETDSQLVLTINETGDRPDVVHFTLPNSIQRDQESGQANLYEIKEEQFATRGSRVFDPLKLNTSSIRLGIRGDDAWTGASIFLWGQQKEDGLIVPLALQTARESGPAQLPNFTISTDIDDAPRSSVPLPRTQLGAAILPIRRMILLLSTADEDDAGTDNPIRLQIVTKDGRLVVDRIFKDTVQDDLEQAQANFYYVPVESTFSRPELDDKSIRLSIIGNDAWLPDRLFLFGLSDDESVPNTVEFVIPMVHLPEWPFGVLSGDSDEGKESVNLPLVATPDLPPQPGPVIL